MATADAGLFGPTPWEIQQAQQQQLQTAATNYANQSPFQRAAQGMFTAGGQLGGMGAQALGGVNVAQQQAAQQQEALQGADIQTPEGYLQMAQKIKDFNPSLAVQLVAKAKALEKEQADIDLKKAQAKKAEAYKAPGSQDPETIRLLDRMTELEAQGLEDTPEYKALAGRVNFLQTVKGGAAGSTGGLKGMGELLAYDPVDKTVKKYNRDRATGKLTTLDGKEVPPEVAGRLLDAASSPEVAARIAQSKSGATTTGKISAEAMAQLPKVESNIIKVKDLGNQLFAHPGFQQLVGAGFPGLKSLAGSSVPGAAALAAQINGIAYLMSREELRGQGQVTENEANAAMSAYNRMNDKLSEADFRKAYADFIDNVERVRDILKQKSNLEYKLPSSNAAPIPSTPVVQPNTTSMTPAKAAGIEGIKEEIRQWEAYMRDTTPGSPSHNRAKDSIAAANRELERMGQTKPTRTFKVLGKE